jgi:dTDP-4-amino-4,6-dideoxygalactose transaminase
MINRIPLLVPDMPGAEEILPFLREIDRARWYTNFGPLTERFEAGMAKELGLTPKSAVAVANCTLGLEVALGALRLPTGARVLVPALTFAATATAILRAGLRPVLADVDQESWILTPSIARSAAGRHELACIMPVAAFGCPQPAATWDVFSNETGIPVLIDAAGAFGNQPIGESAVTVFSFHATKAFGIGEGGLLAVRNEKYIAQVRKLINFGIDISTGLAVAPGTNAKMSEYHAAVGLAALQRWPAQVALRRKVLSQYATSLRRDCPAVRLQSRPHDGIYTIMQVLLPKGTDRGRVVACLAKEGIETRPWYLPLLDGHPAFAGGSVDGDLETARSLDSRLVGLPFHLDLDEQAVHRICSELARALDARA